MSTAQPLEAQAEQKTLGEILKEFRKELKNTPYTLPQHGPVSVEQVARWLQCSERTVYRLVADGILPRIHRFGTSGMRSGGLARMDAAECWAAYAEFMKEQGAGEAAA
jgi:excisionase family DNA binding protein